ncbi:hypothetical protein ABTQ33_12965 (plasmid) [Paucilactobacillus suebicus]|uniref:Prophage Lp2 protein 53 n=1 Tax=Paucilactobacillus suebicus DSM 5007 = KCTC 3549 TaxID=1423807 RepID=A0A0R1VSX4_9LACO|nr:hypothetical protein [Paucilactobacillus suebicus]KRM08826.1 prophage Lp2 protein 53 [Paucilactobacillus suebicus DSM 5007 = KCTC 3549]
MRKLTYTADSPQSIKLGDSNDTLSLRVTEFGQPVDLSKVQSIEVKIGDTNGYLKSIDITAANLLHPTDGRIDVTFTNDNLSDLPAGNYLIEVWIVDSTGDTTIYPDSAYPDVIGFTIDRNIMSSQSSVITTITLADFENKFDDLQKDLQDKATDGEFDGKAATVKVGTVNTGAAGTSATITNSGTDNDAVLDFTIPKGDAGTVDNAGLTAAPAFVELKTQVDNSAVGTNLLINTSGSATKAQTTVQGASAAIYGVYSRTDSYEQVTTPTPDEFYYRFMPHDTNNLYGLTPGETYTLSGSGSHTSGELRFRSQYGPGSNWGSSDVSDLGIPVSDGSVFTPFSHTFTIPVGATGVFFSLQNYDYATDSLFRFKNMKLEKGSVATDWCPNPSEILTQADYAKIQAAIVALGGSLS